MAEKELDIEQLKSRGLTCARLRAMEKSQIKDAQEFRKVGFNQIAESEEQTANKIRNLRQKACLLR